MFRKSGPRLRSSPYHAWEHWQPANETRRSERTANKPEAIYELQGGCSNGRIMKERSPDGPGHQFAYHVSSHRTNNNEHSHVRRAMAQGFVGTDEEAFADSELYGSRQNPQDQRVDRQTPNGRLHQGNFEA